MLAQASTTLAAQARADAALMEELGVPGGALLPVAGGTLPATAPPRDRSRPGGFEQLPNTLRGTLLPVKAQKSSYASAGDAAVNEWSQTRIGPSPPGPLVTLQAQLSRAVLAAAGIPPNMVDGSGAAAREARRTFLAATGRMLADLVAEEATRALGRPTTATLRAGEGDMIMRARAVKQLTDAGMPLDGALAAVGM